MRREPRTEARGRGRPAAWSGILAVLFLFAAAAGGAEAPAADREPRAGEAKAGEPAKAEPDKAQKPLDYGRLVKVLGEILDNPNRLRVQKEMENLAQQYQGRIVLIRAFVEVKSNPLVGDAMRYLWLRKVGSADLRVSFTPDQASFFDGINEFDFVVLEGRLAVAKSSLVDFSFVSLKGIEPLDNDMPLADYVDYNAVLDEARAIRSSTDPGPNSQKRMDLLSRKYQDRLGYLVGEVEGVEEKDGELQLNLRSGRQVVQVLCMDRFRETLESVGGGEKLAVAVRCRRLSATKAHEFFRGCVINLPR